MTTTQIANPAADVRRALKTELGVTAKIARVTLQRYAGGESVNVHVRDRSRVEEIRTVAKRFENADAGSLVLIHADWDREDAEAEAVETEQPQASGAAPFKKGDTVLWTPHMGGGGPYEVVVIDDPKFCAKRGLAYFTGRSTTNGAEVTFNWHPTFAFKRVA